MGLQDHRFMARFSVENLYRNKQNIYKPSGYLSVHYYLGSLSKIFVCAHKSII